MLERSDYKAFQIVRQHISGAHLKHTRASRVGQSKHGAEIQVVGKHYIFRGVRPNSLWPGRLPVDRLLRTNGLPTILDSPAHPPNRATDSYRPRVFTVIRWEVGPLVLPVSMRRRPRTLRYLPGQDRDRPSLCPRVNDRLPRGPRLFQPSRRSPRIHALPPMTAGSKVIRGNDFMLCLPCGSEVTWSSSRKRWMNATIDDCCRRLLTGHFSKPPRLVGHWFV